MPGYLPTLKDGESITFQPLWEEAEEDFNLWNIQKQQWVRSDEIETEEGVQEVNKYIKLTDEEKEKKYSRSMKYKRPVTIIEPFTREQRNREDVEINKGEERFLSLSKKWNKKLDEQMGAVRAMQKDPTEYVFTLTRKGKSMHDTDYVVEIEGHVSEYGEENSFQESSSAPSVDLGLDSGGSKIELTDDERTYVSALKNPPESSPARNYGSEEQVQVLVEKLGTDQDRAEQIVEQEL